MEWFEENGRDLPWRRTRDPLRILVSEFMLQQIQVVRAIPFYEAFLARFPHIESLASAPLADAIRVWCDMGRYRHVVYLHRAAGIIVADHGGSVPQDVPTLMTLPGVGRYTAGTVARFAFETDIDFIDTNMRRVLHRLLLGTELPRPAVNDAELLRIAGDALPSGRA